MNQGVRGGVLAIAALLATPAAAYGSGVDRIGDDTVVETVLDVDPLALTPEMVAFLDARVGRRQPRLARLRALQDAIFDTDNGLGVKYGSAATYTAAETFEHRTGNCLSFTILFVALARDLGLEAYFIEVDQVTGWSQSGELGLNHRHMYAEVEVDTTIVPVDFLPWTGRHYRSRKRISETRVKAHYHNNVGADQLTLGNLQPAIAHFEKALELDPTFYLAKVNLAVALRRDGREDEAERDLLEVLDVEPHNEVAAANLASLYLSEGRRSEAQKWLARRDAFLNRNPFHHFRLGMQALAADELELARRHFKRAIARQPDEAVFFEQLAKTNLRLGRINKGRRNLKRALRYTDDVERRRLIEARLAEVARPTKKSSPSG